MKKFVSIILILSIIFLFTFSINSHAAALDAINITTSKETVNPGTNVDVNIVFGTELGAYTFDIAYDNNLFEYVSSEGGTANDTGDKVIVTYYDTTGGTSPRSNMKVTFKAKEGITTSNPTNFAITATGLSNADATIVYDDITTPIIKNVVVEPKYVDYTISLDYTGDIIVNEEKEMQLKVVSSMGRYYEHARIVAEATTPTDGTVKLIATDASSLEHDIIQSGWGDASGYEIGGDVNQVLNVTALFNKVGDYSITFKLIDRDNSDAEIATKTVNITVKEESGTTPVIPEEPEVETESTKEPTELPKTGTSELFIVLPIMAGLIISFIYLKKKQ